MRESLGGIGLLAPTVLILIGLVLYPFFYKIWMAFTDKTVGSPGQFVGLRTSPTSSRGRSSPPRSGTRSSSRCPPWR
jgi:ABC-type sugar transport system permease subunit